MCIFDPSGKGGERVPRRFGSCTDDAHCPPTFRCDPYAEGGGLCYDKDNPWIKPGDVCTAKDGYVTPYGCVCSGN